MCVFSRFQGRLPIPLLPCTCSFWLLSFSTYLIVQYICKHQTVTQHDSVTTGAPRLTEQELSKEEERKTVEIGAPRIPRIKAFKPLFVFRFCFLFFSSPFFFLQTLVAHHDCIRTRRCHNVIDLMLSMPVETDNNADTLTAHRDNPRIPHRTALQTSYVRALVNRDGEVENTMKQVFTFQLLLRLYVYHKETPKKLMLNGLTWLPLLMRGHFTGWRYKHPCTPLGLL